MGDLKITKPGTLYVVATPIGNLEDITLRALDILRRVEVVACEDTRKTGRLLQRYELKKRLISYYEPVERKRLPLILETLRSGGDVALVSDAGTPGISDPGYPLIYQAISEGLPVVPIPGASAVASALSASGLPCHRFLFLGFPPPKKAASFKLLQSLGSESATLVFYIPVRRIAGFLQTARDVLGDRRIVIAREMTKIHEEFIRGRIDEVLSALISRDLKGEATLLIEGKTRKTAA
jgi:16S rRNA (cytidine1402-2'-O)-methyltransferase